MKKLLLILLALSMIMSLAVTSFADDEGDPEAGDPTYNDTIKAGASKTNIIHHASGYEYEFDDDTNSMETLKSEVKNNHSYGKTVYYALLDKDGYIVNKSEAGEKISIKAEWELGGEFVESLSIVRKKTERDVFGYFLAIKLKSGLNTDTNEVVGTVTLRKNSGDYKFEKVNGKREVKVDVEFDVRYGIARQAEGGKYAYNYIQDATYLHKFNKAEDPLECEFIFEDWEDATFTVKVKDQDPLLIKVTDDFNEDIAATYDLCNLDFFNGNGATFNHRGTLFLPSEYGRFVYERSGTTLKPVPNVVYDEKDEGFYIQTRKLGNFVISDRDIDIYSEVGRITIYGDNSDYED
ncbi:MAG: hypothetical protein IJF25_04035 [Oscillospiraceae bacterium]|nr:hypothetical protein [Oscillospiraceae bacterium]MBQ4537980.1 hypothetical protein [Oscillospiraceae bacterium]